MSISWFIAFGYLFTSAGAFGVWGSSALQSRRGVHQPPESSVWFLTALLLLVMGLGRSANLATTIGELGRRVAENEGWYENRRPVQALVITVVLALFAGVVVTWSRRRDPRRRRITPLALIVTTLIGLVVVRTISLHYLDTVFNLIVFGLRAGDLLEILCLLALIRLATLASLHTGGKGSGHDHRTDPTV
jgi:uncharacterized membrane protein YidH (DUF202 family)